MKVRRMLRSTFFAAGLFIALWGVSFLVIDRVVLKMDADSARDAGFRGLFSTVTADQQRTVSPPDWAAFALMSIGSVTMLYSAALPKKG
jgi:hypothetical protein